jgi:hypothetical protein
MSQSIFDMLSGQLGGQALEMIESQLGADRSQVEKAVPAALGSLMTGLARNAQSSDGASALASALSKDHDGSILDNLSSVLSTAEQGSGAGILGHVFGGKQGAVQSALGQSTGLGAGSIGKLLTMLAPLVMGALGKKQRQGGLDPSDLGGLLRQEQQSAARQAPDLGLLGSLLDADGDGDIKDDVAKLGGSLLKSFLGKRR